MPVRDETDTSSRVHQVRHEVTTRTRIEIVDISEMVNGVVEDSSVECGIVSVSALHTTAAVIVNEHEPRLLEDACAFLERLAPAGAPYRHDDLALRGESLPRDEPANGDAHLRALILGASKSIPVAGGHLVLGRWQSILLVELDGPRRRSVTVTVMGAGRARR